jgi:hypothetical protein
VVAAGLLLAELIHLAVLKDAIGTVSEIADAGHRAEALVGLFLAAYLGLAGPVIGLGALIQITSPRVRMLRIASRPMMG